MKIRFSMFPLIAAVAWALQAMAQTAGPVTTIRAVRSHRSSSASAPESASQTLAVEAANTAAGFTYNVLYNFCSVVNADGACTDGEGPRGLVADASGNLYGVTVYGGANAQGNLFLLDPSGNETVLYSFCSSLNANGNCADGAYPLNGPLRDASGNLYGTTNMGGASQYGLTSDGYSQGGAVFKVDSTGNQTVLYNFCSAANCADGAAPVAGLVQDTAGNLYGTTAAGGAYNGGTVFKLTPSGTETVLHSFCPELAGSGGCPDGASPVGGLVADPAGNLYGTTTYGGIPPVSSDSGGVLFRVDTSGNFTVLYSFCSAANCADGSIPEGALVRDSAGNLYGTTSAGGAGEQNSGTVFKLDHSGNYSVLYSFCSAQDCADGRNPLAGLTLDSSGNLYGTTAQGGAGNLGTIFRLDTQGNQTVLYSFCSAVLCADGAGPAASLTMDSAGSIYGTTEAGGSSAAGTVFKLAPTTGVGTAPGLIWPSPSAISYGTPLGGVELDATAGVPGTFAYSPSAGSVLGAGTQTLRVTFTPSDPAQYATAATTVKLTVNKAAQTIAFAPPASPVAMGVAPINLSATGGASGMPVTFSLISGPGSLSGTNDSVLTVTGTGAIVVAANQAGNANYAAASQVTATVVVNPVLSPSSLASPAAGSVLAGPSVTFTWAATPAGASYQLLLGSTGPGSANICNSGSTKAASIPINSLPTNGETIYARLFTTLNGVTVSSDSTFTAASQATFTSPVAGARLAGSTVTFQWAASAGASSYELWLGTTGPNSANLYNSGHVTANSVTVTNLPVNGEAIYATLYTTFGSVTVHANSTFTAAWEAAFVSPAVGSRLLGPTVTFSWTAGAGTVSYQLLLGTTVGSANLFNSGTTTATSILVRNLPTNGETIYATLNTIANGTTLQGNYTFAAASQAQFTSPLAGSTLTGTTVTFSWAASSGASSFELWLGTTAGGANLYNSSGTTATSVVVKGLPTNGETIYATLYTTFAGVTVHSGYTFTAVSQAAFTSPVAGSTLTGPTVTFSWTAASAAASYELWLGTTAGGANLYNSSGTTATSVVVRGLPTNGETIYATLYTTLNGFTVHGNYTFIAASQAAFTSPAAGSTLSGPNVTFSWAAGSGATSYELWLGPTPGSANLYNSTGTTATSVVVRNLPTNGETIYATLYTTFSGVTVHSSYTFTAASQAAFTSPFAGSTLTATTVTFSWAASSGAASYEVWLGTTPGSANLYNSGNTTATSATVRNLPANGEPIYATLYTTFAGVTVHAPCTFTAYTAP